MSAAASTPRFVVLDSFRGLCALSVAIFHLHILGSFTELPFFRSAGLFVEFFFTLSGFVLCHSYAQKAFGQDRLRAFLIGRVFRIFPLHVFMLLLFTLLAVVRSVWLAEGELFDMDWWSQWWPNALLLQAWLPHTNPFSFNGPAWSISVEFYIYILFGGLLFAFFAYHRWIFALIALVAAACVLSGQSWTSTGGFRGVHCFFIGALAYQAYQYSAQWRIAAWLAHGLELLLLLGIYAVLVSQYPYRSMLASSFFALCIVVFAREQGAVSRVLRTPFFVHLGHWSFSIYLTHYLLLDLLYGLAAVSQLSWLQSVRPEGSYLNYLTTASALGNTFLGLAVLGLVLAVSALSYQQIELRGMAWGKRLVQRWRLGVPKSELALQQR